MPRPVGQEKSRRKSVTNTRVSMRMHLRCAGDAVKRLCIRWPSPTPARREPHLGCEQRVKSGAWEDSGIYGDAEARKTPSHTPGADCPGGIDASTQHINSNKEILKS